MSTNIEDSQDAPQGEVLVRAWEAGTRRPVPMSEVLLHGHDPRFREELLQGVSDPDPAAYLSLDRNLVVNQGRQALANLIGGRDYDATVPNSDWVVKYCRFGTYDEAPRFNDTTLSPQPLDGVYVGGENTIDLGGYTRKLITAVDWPQPFLVRFEIELAPDEANGQMIRELGLFTGNDTLFARKAIVPIVKTASIGVTVLWRIRTALTFWFGISILARSFTC